MPKDDLDIKSSALKKKSSKSEKLKFKLKKLKNI